MGTYLGVNAVVEHAGNYGLIKVYAVKEEDWDKCPDKGRVPCISGGV